MNKVMELQPLIMESSLGMQVQRMEERAWRKKMEEKQEQMEKKQEQMEKKQEQMEERQKETVALLNQLISLQTRESGKAE